MGFHIAFLDYSFLPEKCEPPGKRKNKKLSVCAGHSHCDGHMHFRHHEKLVNKGQTFKGWSSGCKT